MRTIAACILSIIGGALLYAGHVQAIAVVGVALIAVSAVLMLALLRDMDRK